MSRDKYGSARVARATAADVPAMAQCHAACFPRQFTSRMGSAYVEALYAFYLAHPGGISLVATDPRAEVLGLCVGGAPEVYGEFLATARWRFARTIVWGVLSDLVVRRSVLARVRQALSPSRRDTDVAAVAPAAGGDRWAMLQIIAVQAEARGKGAADRLVEAFGAACEAAGYRAMRLVVQRENPRALAFYRRHGWQVQGERGESVHLGRALGRDGGP